MSNRAKIRLDEIQTLMSDRNFKTHILNFLEKYIECEVVCKELIVANKAYSKNPVKYEDVKMRYDSILSAVRGASLHVDENTLKRLFYENKKKGERSAKYLRNGIVHRLPKSELKEINQRYRALMKDMRSFLNSVK